MNPLSIWTFYRRHKRRAALLLSLISLVTAGLYLMGALLSAIYIEPGRLNFMYLSKFSVVMPESFENGPDPAVIAQIRANPDVTNVIPTSTIWITVPGLMSGEGTGFYLLGLLEEDMPYILERCGVTLKEGNLLKPGTNGLMLEENVATSLGVQVGDTIHDSVDSELYASVASPLEVVGILESDVRLGILSLEYIIRHEFYREFPTMFLVVPRESREAAVDDFLRDEILTARTDVQTFKMLSERMVTEYFEGLVVLAPIVAIVGIAFSLVIVVVNWIAFSRRIPEFGTLHAMGYGKRCLVGRLTLETAALASIGWVIGIGLSWLVLYVFKVALFTPRGHDLSIIQLLSFGFTIPIPTAVAGFTFLSARRILSPLDAVTVIEWAGQNIDGNRKRKMMVTRSSPKPLAPATFYSRHRRRAVLFISAMSLMIVAVVLIIFVLAASFDAKEPGLGYLSQLSILRSPGVGRSLDPGVVARVRTHPAVERVIPIAPRYHMLSVYIPPFTAPEASPFGVYAEDMAYLVELYGLELKEGRLPRPYTNEMVIPETLAQNRALEVGDVVGNPDHPAYPGAEALPAEFVISGIITRSAIPQEENWLGFVSLEYLEGHEAFHVPDIPALMIVPNPGQKDSLDEWLENELVGEFASVLTHHQELARVRKGALNQMLAIAFLESVVAIVAAISLAVLNYILISERKAEFGVLHALGYGRLQLVWRTIRETLFTTGIAWGFSVLLFLVGLLYLQWGVFKPLGIRLNIFNLTPWLFTLPIPIAVMVATIGTTTGTLTKLDPVSIIERR
jgi:ABC-type lipoprotein release transport system permease subunit